MEEKQKSYTNVASSVLLILVISALCFAILSHKNPENNTVNQQVICTMEAKLCPDGSYVGRTGPNCEFSICPSTVLSDSGKDNGITPYNSGVEGKVILGPTCPVEKVPADPSCASKPYKTLVAVFRESDPVHPFLLTTSDASGMFSASLPPGNYVLGAGESNLPSCDHPLVSVKANSYTKAVISCDTGIR